MGGAAAQPYGPAVGGFVGELADGRVFSGAEGAGGLCARVRAVGGAARYAGVGGRSRRRSVERRLRGGADPHSRLQVWSRVLPKA